LGNAVSEFAEQYADQNDQDFAACVEAIDTGRTEARDGGVSPLRSGGRGGPPDDPGGG
jgi:hypothetical protein